MAKMLKKDWIALCEQQTAEINKLRDEVAGPEAQIANLRDEISRLKRERDGLKRALAAPATQTPKVKDDPFDRRKVEKARGYWNIRVRPEFEATYSSPARALAALAARSRKPIERVVCKRDVQGRLWLNVYPSA